MLFSCARSEFSLNFHGRVSSTESPEGFLAYYKENEKKLSQFDPRNKAHDKFIVNAVILESELKIFFSYDTYLFSRNTIQKLLNGVMNELDAL